MLVTAKSLRIKGKEKRTSNRSGKDYLIVRVEDETGKTIELLDWQLENMERYPRDQMADFELNLDVGKFVNVSIKNFTLCSNNP